MVETRMHTSKQENNDTARTCTCLHILTAQPGVAHAHCDCKARVGKATHTHHGQTATRWCGKCMPTAVTCVRTATDGPPMRWHTQIHTNTYTHPLQSFMERQHRLVCREFWAWAPHLCFVREKPVHHTINRSQPQSVESIAVASSSMR